MGIWLLGLQCKRLPQSPQRRSEGEPGGDEEEQSQPPERHPTSRCARSTSVPSHIQTRLGQAEQSRAEQEKQGFSPLAP